MFLGGLLGWPVDNAVVKLFFELYLAWLLPGKEGLVHILVTLLPPHLPLCWLAETLNGLKNKLANP